MSFTRAGLVWALALGLAACSQGSSDGRGGRPIPTDQVSLFVLVGTTNGVLVEVVAWLEDKEALGTELILNGGDALVACVGSDCAPLEPDAGGLSYQATLPYEPGEDYVVSFLRPEEVDAHSTVRIADPFDLVAPSQSSSASPGDWIDVEWSLPPPLTYPVVAVLSHCFEGASLIYSDRRYQRPVDPDGDGFDSYLFENLVPLPTVPFDICFATLEVSQYVYGQSDPNLGAGRISGWFTRTRGITYEP